MHHIRALKASGPTQNTPHAFHKPLLRYGLLDAHAAEHILQLSSASTLVDCLG